MNEGDDFSDGDDKVGYQPQNNGIRQSLMSPPSYIPVVIGPTLNTIENLLFNLQMPALTNIRLSPVGISLDSISYLAQNFGQYAPHLYQMIRLMKWDLFQSNITSEYAAVESEIIQILQDQLGLERTYINEFLKSKMYSTKSKGRDSRSISTCLNRMCIDYRNDQILEWHRRIKYPTRQFLRGALHSFYFSNDQGTSNFQGSLIPMGKSLGESILTMVASS